MGDARDRLEIRVAMVAMVCIVALACGDGGGGGDTDAGRDAQSVPDAGDIVVKVLAINDFQGTLHSPGVLLTGAGAVPVGGAAYLATHLEAASVGVDSTIIVSAGDLVGATPLVSALFHDEPTIEVMNALGLGINAIGNHEFDEDVDELLRMKNGGCHPTEGCFGGDGFAGASFTFLAANSVRTSSGEPLFAPYEVRTLGGVEIAFLGLTAKNTPALTTPITDVEFLDEISTINSYVTQLVAQGIENIVVVIHEGGYVAGGGENQCVSLSGRIHGIVSGLDPAVDLVISGHTHRVYNCVVGGIPVTSAQAEGRFFSDITLEIDPTTKLIKTVRAVNRAVLHDVTPDAEIAALVDRYQQLSNAVENEVIGTISEDIVKAMSTSGESPLGSLVTDAMLAATPGSQVAFQHPGGVRTDLLYAASGGESQDGQVRFGELFAVQPFTNIVVTMTLTGQQIHDLLEEQWTSATSATLQASAGFSYTWSASGTPGDRVDPAAVLVNGTPLVLSADYTITSNSFLATGGGGYSVFEQGTNLQTVMVDVDALANYIRDNSPVGPPAAGRIIRGL